MSLTPELEGRNTAGTQRRSPWQLPSFIRRSPASGQNPFSGLARLPATGLCVHRCKRTGTGALGIVRGAGNRLARRNEASIARSRRPGCPRPDIGDFGAGPDRDACVQSHLKRRRRVPDVQGCKGSSAQVCHFCRMQIGREGQARRLPLGAAQHAGPGAGHALGRHCGQGRITCWRGAAVHAGTGARPDANRRNQTTDSCGG